MQPLPEVTFHDTAFFFDFDGTLSPIVENPAMARPAARAMEALSALLQACSGAVGIISGRSIEQLDSFLTPLRLPIAGVHGLEVRYPDGRLISHVTQQEAIRAAHDRLSALAAAHDGLLVETKPGSVTIHFRMRPDLERQCAEAASELAARLAGLELLEGKMVFELKQPGRSKVSAIRDFVETEPFARRRLFYAGDDVADEQVFAYVQQGGGTAIKVGDGSSIALHRAGSPEQLAGWLLSMLQQQRRRG